MAKEKLIAPRYRWREALPDLISGSAIPEHPYRALAKKRNAARPGPLDPD